MREHKKIDISKILKILGGNTASTGISTLLTSIVNPTSVLAKGATTIVGKTIGDYIVEKMSRAQLNDVESILLKGKADGKIYIPSEIDLTIIVTAIENFLEDQNIEDENIENTISLYSNIENQIRLFLDKECYDANEEIYITKSAIYVINTILEWLCKEDIFPFLMNNITKNDELSYRLKKIENGVLSLQTKENTITEQRNFSKIKNKIDDYSKKWNQNLFLNNYDEYGEDSGVNITLSQLYTTPKYIYKDNTKSNDNLEEFLFSKSWKMLIILGLPGSGKTSLLIKYLQKNLERNGSNDNIILVKSTELFDSKDYNNGIITLDQMLREKVYEKIGEWKNKVLIIDGFDESNLYNRKEILEKFSNILFEDNDNPPQKVIITCRENYIMDLESQKYTYIHLCAFDDDKIDQFIDQFIGISKKDVSDSSRKYIKQNKMVYGIPIILYMVLSLDIPINSDMSEVDIYDYIFNIENGIYDRCFKVKNKIYGYAEKTNHSDVKNEIHQLNRNLAFWMFENNSEHATISINDFKIIKSRLNLDNNYYLDYYFKMIHHIDGMNGEDECNIEFIHRTLYEYFVIEQIFTIIASSWNNRDDKCLVGNLPFFLKKGQLSSQMELFLSKKLKNLLSEDSREFFEWWNKNFCTLLKDGMFSRIAEKTLFNGEINKNELLRQCAYKEVNCCIELICLSQIILNICIEKNDKYRGYIGNSETVNNLINYVSSFSWKDNIVSGKNIYKKFFERNERGFWGINLSNVNWEYLCLYNKNLSNANLKNAIFKDVDFIYSNFSNSDLENGQFWGETSISSVDFTFSDLNNVIIDASYKNPKEWRAIAQGNFDNITITARNNNNTFSHAEFEKIYLKENF